MGLKMMRSLQKVCLLAMLLVPTWAGADGIADKAKDAVDPDCTVGKAVKGAATKAVVGIRGNRCDVGETARDTLGIDDRERSKKSDDGEGALSRLRKD
jgi:hypothetical protein